ncbi:hypothetical protein LX36DRAFT_397281 [Colletotrichum falcatum]|nr:hypothetical protein LX36DRAFT_397281 [Colletotrichum falcatum]
MDSENNPLVMANATATLRVRTLQLQYCTAYPCLRARARVCVPHCPTLGEVRGLAGGRRLSCGVDGCMRTKGRRPLYPVIIQHPSPSALPLMAATQPMSRSRNDCPWFCPELCRRPAVTLEEQDATVASRQLLTTRQVIRHVEMGPGERKNSPCCLGRWATHRTSCLFAGQMRREG